jgi:nitrate/nitrite transport system substrate-binding protein
MSDAQKSAAHVSNGHSGVACPCGSHSSMEEHHKELGEAVAPGDYDGPENYVNRIVETSVLRTMFPETGARRAFLKSVGASTALAAISRAFPLDAAKALAMDAMPLEKTKATLGFVPITCTVPILLADAMGEYRKEGLDVSLVRTPGWSVARDKLANGEYDASHMVLALPQTMSLGIGSPKINTTVSAIQNINGDAIALHVKHKDRRNPSTWKGFKFGIPHDHSMHAMLLRYYLAEHGIDPDNDVQLRVYPPPDSVANMAAGNLDGMLFAEPWNQRAVFEGVAFIQALSRDIFPDHPCCTFAVTEKFVQEMPNTYGALFRAVVRAAAFADKYENRSQVSELLAPPKYLNQPLPVLQQVLLGRYADGLGNIVERHDRIGFKTFPHQSTSVWLLTQLKRWKFIPADIDVIGLSKQVFLSTDAAKRMRDLGIEPPLEPMIKHTIMGKEFDPMKPDSYLNSFAIKRI